MRVLHSDGEIVHIEFAKGIELSMFLVDANELHKELTWVLDSINPEPAPQTSEDEVSPNSAEPKPVTGSLPCGEHNTASPKLLSELKVIDCLIQCGGVKSLEQAHDRLYAVITQLQA